MDFSLEAITLKEKAEMAYRFLTCKSLFKREINIIGDEKDFVERPGYIFPKGIIKAGYTDSADHDEFIHSIKACHANIYGVASIDSEDTKRITLIPVQNDAAMATGLKPGFILKFHDDNVTEEEMEEILNFIEPPSGSR